MQIRSDSTQSSSTNEENYLENVSRFFSIIAAPNENLFKLKNSYLEFIKKAINDFSVVFSNSPSALKLLTDRFMKLYNSGFFKNKMPSDTVKKIIDDIKTNGSYLKSQLNDDETGDEFITHLLTIDDIKTPSYSKVILVPKKMRAGQLGGELNAEAIPAQSYLSDLHDKSSDALMARNWPLTIHYCEEAIFAVKEIKPLSKNAHFSFNIKAFSFHRMLAMAYYNSGTLNLEANNLVAAIKYFHDSAYQLMLIPVFHRTPDDTRDIKEYKANYIKTVNIKAVELRNANKKKEFLFLTIKAANDIDFEYSKCEHELALIRHLVEAALGYARYLIKTGGVDADCIGFLRETIERNSIAYKHLKNEFESANEIILKRYLIYCYYIFGKKIHKTNAKKSILYCCVAFTEACLIKNISITQDITKLLAEIGKTIIDEFGVELDIAYTWLEKFLLTPRNSEINTITLKVMFRIAIKQAQIYKQNHLIDKAIEKIVAVIDLSNRYEYDDIRTESVNAHRSIAELNYEQVTKIRNNFHKVIMHCHNGILASAYIPHESMKQTDADLSQALRISFEMHLQHYQTNCIAHRNFDVFIDTISKTLPVLDIPMASKYIRSLVYVALQKANFYLSQNNFKKAMESYLYAESTWKMTPREAFSQLELISSASINLSIIDCLLREYNCINNNSLFCDVSQKINLLLQASQRYEEICSDQLSVCHYDGRANVFSLIAKYQLDIKRKLNTDVKFLLHYHKNIDVSLMSHAWAIDFDNLLKLSLTQLTEDMSSEQLNIAIALLKTFRDANNDYPNKEHITACINSIKDLVKISLQAVKIQSPVVKHNGFRLLSK